MSVLVRLLAIATVLAGPLPAAAQDFTVGAIRVSQIWSPVPPEGSRVAGAFMTITNTGNEPDTLIGGTAAVAGRIEVHEMSLDKGVMKMRELKPGLVVKPGETVVLKPGSFHLMLMDMKERPVAGKPFEGTLVFEKAGTLRIEYRVEPFGTRTPGDGGQAAKAGHGSHGGHGGHKGSGHH